MRQRWSPHRCAVWRGLFICRITWRFSTCGESDRTTSALRGALTSICPQTYISSTQLPYVPWSWIEKGEASASAACFQDVRCCWTLMTTQCAVWFLTTTHNPHPWTQTKTTCCSTGKHPTQVTPSSRILCGNLAVSRLHLIGWRAQAYINVNWFIQNNTPEHINLYSRGDQM